MEYESITGGSHSPIEVPEILRCTGATYISPWTDERVPPASQTREGPDDSFVSWKSPVSSELFNQPGNRKVIMNPYAVGTLSTSYALASTYWDERFRRVYWKNDQTTCCDHFFGIGSRAWSEKRDFNRLTSAYPTVTRSGFSASKILDAMAASQIAATASAAQSLDLLTEIAEAGKTFRFVSDSMSSAAAILRNVGRKVPISARRWRQLSPRELLKSGDKALQAAGNLWLSGVYGVMPIVYGISDVMKLKAESGRFYESYHSQRTVEPDSHSVSLPDECLVNDETGSIEVRSTVRKGYELGSLQRIADGIGLNPLSTVWELIPYSFVVDWFVNVGDLIRAQTSMDLSTYSGGCTSIRRKVESTTTWHDHSEVVYDLSLQISGPCQAQISRDYVHSYVREDDQVVRNSSESSYQRVVFQEPPMKLVFDPDLEWSNIITAFALGYRPIRKLLRSLR